MVDVVGERAHLLDVERADLGVSANHASSPGELSNPAPYAFGPPCSRITPNSALNQNTSARNCRAASSPRGSSPRRHDGGARRSRGQARQLAWPITSWITSGSGVYSGAPSQRTYCVDVNRLVANAPKNSCRRDQPGDRPIAESRQRAQPGVDLRQLRDAIGRQIEPIPRGEHVRRGVRSQSGRSVADTVAQTSFSVSV